MAAGVPGRTLLLLLLSLLLLAVGQLAAEESTGHDVYIGGLQGTGRRLTQVGNSTTNSSSTKSDRTVRIDPLDKLRKYRGGYDITKKHYWSSLIFTGILGYSLAVLWLLLGAVYGLYRVVAGCCADRSERCVKKSPCTTRRPRICPAVAALLLTLFVLVASCVALAGSSRFHSSARSIKRIIGHVADNASGTISNITGAVTAMQFNPVAFKEMERITHLNATSLRLTQEAVKIKDKAEKSVRLIGKGLKILQTTTIVIVSLNIVIVLVLLGSRFLRLNRTLRVLLVVFWVMTSLFWLFFGLYFFIGEFSVDTCTALEDYQQDPRNSSLSSILPCSDQSSGNSALKDTRAGIYNLINKVNANISAMQPRRPRQAPIGIICNPFSPPPHYDYNPDHCSQNATKIGDIPKLLAGFVCPGSEQGSKCVPRQFISADNFHTLTVYTASIQSLLDSFPGVERLVNCKLVKEAFSQVLLTQCRPLKKYSKMAWVSMAAASTVMVLLALTWVAMGCGVGDSHAADGGSSIIPRDHSPGCTPARMEMAEKDDFSKPEP